MIDSSALLAVLFGEPEGPGFVRKIAEDGARLISAATLLEAGMLVEARRGESAGRELDLFLHRAAVRCVAVDERQATLARAAWRRFGKGRHPAALDYGDCFSYALARATNEPLLFKGGDFAKTDIPAA